MDRKYFFFSQSHFNQHFSQGQFKLLGQVNKYKPPGGKPIQKISAPKGNSYKEQERGQNALSAVNLYSLYAVLPLSTN